MNDGVREAGESAELVAEISAWEDSPRVAPPDSVPVLSIDGFEGPLDWLLEMAQARRIDLARLSITALIDAFAIALEAALARRVGHRAAELGRWGVWLVMAATLAFPWPPQGGNRAWLEPSGGPRLAALLQRIGRYN